MTFYEDFSEAEWTALLHNEQIFKYDNILIMRRLMDIGGEATCSQLANKYGKSWGYYNSMCSNLAKRVADFKQMELEKHDGQEIRWPVLFTGREVSSKDDVDGSFIWILKPNLKKALENMNLKEYEPLYENETPRRKKNIAQANLNDFFKTHFWGEERIISSKSDNLESYYISLTEDGAISLWYEWWKNNKETCFAISVDFDSEENLEQKAERCGLDISKGDDVWKRKDVVFDGISYQGKGIGPRGGIYDDCAYMTQYIRPDCSWEDQEKCLDRFFNHPFVRESNQFKELVAQRIVANMNKRAGETSLRLVDKINPIKWDEKTLFIQYKPFWANGCWKEKGFHYEFRVTDKEISIEFHGESIEAPSTNTQTEILPLVYGGWVDGFKLSIPNGCVVFPKLNSPNGFINEAVNRMVQLEKEFGNKIIEFIGQKDIVMVNTIVELLKNNHNIILHGAPGTGKTFLAKKIAEAMGAECEMIQFHQSYDYTDFVEGLRPVQKKDSTQISFERQDGIFKVFCGKAQKNLEDSAKSQEVQSIEAYWTAKIDAFLDAIMDGEISQEDWQTSKTANHFTISSDDSNIFVSIPENPKTDEIKFPKETLVQLLSNNLNLKRVVDVKAFYGRKHNFQSDSYAFVLYHKIKDWTAKKEDIPTIENIVQKKDYVFIIDEINRGEMSKILGELFFSIDPGYRGKKGDVRTQYANLQKDQNEFDKALGIVDSNNFGHFFVPENVYIIGTMNDIDRSVESMDFAMRRRFAFEEVTAEQSMSMFDNPESWKDGKNEIVKIPDDVLTRLKNRMRNLNAAILDPKLNLGQAYQIGGAYFLKFAKYFKDGEEKAFANLWNYHLKGLLTEYLRGMPKAADHLKKLKECYDESIASESSASSDNTSDSAENP